MEKPDIRVLRSYLGVKFPGDESACWEMIRQAYREFLAAELKRDPWSCVAMFETVREPQPWDVVVMRNHPILANHVGIYLGDGKFIHVWDHDVGAVIGFLDRAPWSHPGRVVGFMRLKEETT